MGELSQSRGQKRCRRAKGRSLAKRLAHAGVASLELQAEAKFPSSAVIDFISSAAQPWPPYDARTGLYALSELSCEENWFRVVFFVEPCGAEAESCRVVLDIQSAEKEDIEKVDIPFGEIERFFQFLRSKERSFSFGEVRGVLHQELDAPPKQMPLPADFNERVALVGVRFAAKQSQKAPRMLLENVIVEVSEKDRVHLRLATRKFRPTGLSLRPIINKVLACHEDLPKFLGRPE